MSMPTIIPPMIYHTGDEHANHYITNVVSISKKGIIVHVVYDNHIL